MLAQRTRALRSVKRGRSRGQRVEPGRRATSGFTQRHPLEALHFNVTGQSQTAERYVRKSSLPFLVSELAELEARRAFVRRTGQSRSEPWGVFRQKLDAGTWLRYPVPWEQMVSRSVELIERYGAQLNAMVELGGDRTHFRRLEGCP